MTQSPPATAGEVRDLLLAESVVVAMLKAAYVAGFMNSAEGYNGEYPFDGEPDREIYAYAEGYAQKALQRPLPSGGDQ